MKNMTYANRFHSCLSHEQNLTGYQQPPLELFFPTVSMNIRDNCHLKIILRQYTFSVFRKNYSIYRSKTTCNKKFIFSYYCSDISTIGISFERISSSCPSLFPYSSVRESAFESSFFVCTISRMIDRKGGSAQHTLEHKVAWQSMLQYHRMALLIQSKTDDYIKVCRRNLPMIHEPKE